jgi:hypothetical protein
MIVRKLFSELKKKVDRTANIRSIKNYTVILLQIRELRRVTVTQANTSFPMLHTYFLLSSCRNNADEFAAVKVT